MSLPPLSPDAAVIEERYQLLAGKYYLAQAEFLKVITESTRLRAVIRAKQQVIDTLLPHYPFPLSAELQAAIALT
jgi:hypothetical protein